MPAVSSRGRGRRTINEINMVPFIDVMLVLLIIFMAVPANEAPSVVNLPRAVMTTYDQLRTGQMGLFRLLILVVLMIGVIAAMVVGLAAIAGNPHLAAGLNVHRGRLTHKAAAESLGLPYAPAEQAIAG